MRACRQCGERRFQRIHRNGFWERWVLAVYGLYPWVCRKCGHKMYRFKENAPPADPSREEARE
jgi:ribosomal protein L40E